MGPNTRPSSFYQRSTDFKDGKNPVRLMWFHRNIKKLVRSGFWGSSSPTFLPKISSTLDQASWLLSTLVLSISNNEARATSYERLLSFDLPSSEMPTVMSSRLLHGSLGGSRIFFQEGRISCGFPVVSLLERGSKTALEKSMPDSSFFTDRHCSGVACELSKR